MLKKYLVAVAMLSTAGFGTAESASPAASTPVVTTTTARSALNCGFSAGINAGYQTSKIKTKAAVGDFKVNSPVVGVHVDYNYPISNPLFVGAGLSLNSSFKKHNRQFTADAANYTISAKRTISGALTVRTGVVSGPVAFEINGAVLLTGVKVKFTPGNDKFKSENNTRVGFAPGVGFTYAVAKNVSAGINYRYEIYPKSKNSTGLKGYDLNSHNVFAKLSYHFSK